MLIAATSTILGYAWRAHPDITPLPCLSGHTCIGLGRSYYRGIGGRMTNMFCSPSMVVIKMKHVIVFVH